MTLYSIPNKTNSYEIDKYLLYKREWVHGLLEWISGRRQWDVLLRFNEWRQLKSREWEKNDGQKKYESDKK
jgi:hypothetical protein